MYKAKHLSPMVPSYNMKETIAFFVSLLDFTPFMNEKEYAILTKDNVMVHILPAGSEIGEMEFYLEVDDIEEIWKTMQSASKELNLKEPFDREYGMREIHVIIPHTKTLLFIGQPLK